MHDGRAALQWPGFYISRFISLTAVSSQQLAELKALAGPGAHVEDPAELAASLTEWRGLFRGAAPLMLMPDSTAAVSAILGYCHRQRIAVVPQGGNTGLVGGAIPYSTDQRAEILLSARRLNRIRSIDAANYSITAEAGCVLARLQAAAADAGRLFPLSLAAEGSCQLGGNLSTNAGGTAVLRFGTTRDLVLGLEVVLPDGRVLDSLRSLRKDNTGYDLKQLFIGAEGTLGFITAASCKLFPQPRQTSTAWLAVPDVAAALSLYGAARDSLGDELTAFEFANRQSLAYVIKHIPGSRAPLAADSPWQVLLEVGTARESADTGADLERFLAGMLDRGAVTDGMVAASGAQRDALWRLRHSMSEAQKIEGASIKHDISVPVSKVGEFVARASAWAESAVPGVRVVAFGHLGDGNVHFNLSQPVGADPAAFLARWDEIAGQVHQIAVDFGGSFSAEHGIGSLKVAELERWRGGVTLELMRAIKGVLDPHNIMNPGKLLRAP
jgi:FAD/FMN-containing dehydrogenase